VVRYGHIDFVRLV